MEERKEERRENRFFHIDKVTTYQAREKHLFLFSRY